MLHVDNVLFVGRRSFWEDESQVSSVMGLGPTGADGQVLQSYDVCSAEFTGQCSGTPPTTTVASEHDPLLCISMLLLLFTWLVFGGVAVWFFMKWKKGMKVAISDSTFS